MQPFSCIFLYFFFAFVSFTSCFLTLAHSPGLDRRLAPDVASDEANLDNKAEEASNAPGHQRHHLHRVGELLANSQRSWTKLFDH